MLLIIFDKKYIFKDDDENKQFDIFYKSVVIRIKNTILK